MTIIKFVTVLNQSAPPGRTINAGLHAACGLMRRLESERTEQAAEWFDARDFADSSGNSHPYISARSHIVLEGKGNEIRKLREQLIAAGVTFVDFHTGMQDGSVDEQLARSAGTVAENVEYLALSAAGPAEVLNPLTKRLSLWRGKAGQ